MQCFSDPVGTWRMMKETIFWKRTVLFGTAFLAYVDVLFDIINAVQLWKKKRYYWSCCIASLLFIPNMVTWAFLHANGMATCKDLAVIMLQLGPLRECWKSWESGKETNIFLWFMVAEGLGESTLTGVLNGYIMTFGDVSWTFSVSFFWSLIQITKTAVALNFYGREDTTIREKIVEFCIRFPTTALRISSLSCFGYLMRRSCDAGDDLTHSTQTALPCTLIFSFCIVVAIILAVEPAVPLPVCMYFAMAMLFTTPMQFLSCFEKMFWVISNLRFVETVILMDYAINPLDLNPCIFHLLDQAPILSYTLVTTFTIVLLHLGSSLLLSLCHGRDAARCVSRQQYGKLSQNPAKPELQREQLRGRLHAAVRVGDLVMVNLLVTLEGASLIDPDIVQIARSAERESLQSSKFKELVSMGMPENAKALKERGFDASSVRAAGFTVVDLKEAGYSQQDLMPLTLKAEISFEEMKTAGYALLH